MEYKFLVIFVAIGCAWIDYPLPRVEAAAISNDLLVGPVSIEIRKTDPEPTVDKATTQIQQPNATQVAESALKFIRSSMDLTPDESTSYRITLTRVEYPSAMTINQTTSEEQLSVRTTNNASHVAESIKKFIVSSLHHIPEGRVSYKMTVTRMEEPAMTINQTTTQNQSPAPTPINDSQIVRVRRATGYDTRSQGMGFSWPRYGLVRPNPTPARRSPASTRQQPAPAVQNVQVPSSVGLVEINIKVSGNAITTTATNNDTAKDDVNDDDEKCKKSKKAKKHCRRKVRHHK